MFTPYRHKPSGRTVHALRWRRGLYLPGVVSGTTAGHVSEREIARAVARGGRFTPPHVHDAAGNRIEVRPGDWVLQDPSGRGHAVAEHGAFIAEHEPIGGDDA